MEEFDRYEEKKPPGVPFGEFRVIKSPAELEHDRRRVESALGEANETRGLE